MQNTPSDISKKVIIIWFASYNKTDLEKYQLVIVQLTFHGNEFRQIYKT